MNLLRSSRCDNDNSIKKNADDLLTISKGFLPSTNASNSMHLNFADNFIHECLDYAAQHLDLFSARECT